MPHEPWEPGDGQDEITDVGAADATAPLSEEEQS